jgi:hypothetical protein
VGVALLRFSGGLGLGLGLGFLNELLTAKEFKQGSCVTPTSAALGIDPSEIYDAFGPHILGATHPTAVSPTPVEYTTSFHKAQPKSVPVYSPVQRPGSVPTY